MVPDKFGQRISIDYTNYQVASLGPVTSSVMGNSTAGVPGAACTCRDGQPSQSQFVYVLGTVDIRFPDQSISEEFQTVARTIDVVQREDEDFRSWCHRVLTHPEGRKARYVARLSCWILTVEGQPAYYLTLRDLDDLPDLVECLGRRETEDALPHEDLDLFVGLSSMIPVELSPSITVPILAVEQVCSFKKEDIVHLCSRSSEAKRSTKKRAPESHEADANLSADPDRLFRVLVQCADNFGDKDEWRALNYLAVRYSPIYEMYAALADEYELESVKVAPSRLSREKRIVDPIFTFRHKKTGSVCKYFVRVDVSHMFPMIVSHLAESFER